MITAVNEFLDDLRGGRMTESPIVSVEQGKLQGRVVTSPSGKSFYSFQGIPYAKPPLGSLRFKAPQPAEPWDDIRDATSEGNVAPQIDPIFTKSYVGDENCLYLNVYTPNLDGEFHPVMIYLHGGGFKNGSGSASLYGADYLVEKDVIVVTINYRLGALGFLSLNTPEVPGNAGLKDIAQALRWVKENIHNFGGNSGNLTLFGESSGGVATSILTASPVTKELINKAIIQSGTALCQSVFQSSPIENAKKLVKFLGSDAEDVDEILDFLNATHAKELVEAAEKLADVEFGALVEKEFPGVEAILTEPFYDVLVSGRVSDVPVMIGSTTLELTLDRKSDDLQDFIPKDLNIARNSDESVRIANSIKSLYFQGSHIGVESLKEYFELLSDTMINVHTHRHVKYLVKVSNKPIYYYKFDYVGELNWTKKLLTSLGLNHAGHLDELGYLFSNELTKDVEPTSQDLKMRERMVRLWTNFAKSGNPTPDENHFLTVTWLPVTHDNLYYLNLGSELSLGSNPDKEKMDFWDDIYAKHFRIWEQPSKNTAGDITNSFVAQDPVLTPEEPHELVNSSAEVEDVQSEIVESVTEVTVENTLPEVNDAPIINSELVKQVDDINAEDKVDFVQNEPEVEIVNEEIPETIVEDSKIDVIENNNANHNNVQQNGVKTNEYVNGNSNDFKKPRTSNEIKMHQANGAPKDVIRANDPPEDDLPKNIGVNKFVNFFESLGGKK